MVTAMSSAMEWKFDTIHDDAVRAASSHAPPNAPSTASRSSIGAGWACKTATSDGVPCVDP